MSLQPSNSSWITRRYIRQGLGEIKINQSASGSEVCSEDLPRESESVKPCQNAIDTVDINTSGERSREPQPPKNHSLVTVKVQQQK